MSDDLAPPIVGHIGDLPDEPGDVPGLPTLHSDGKVHTRDQDAARSEALRLYRTEGLPFLKRTLESKKTSDRLKFDAVKLLGQQALPPPQPILGDVDITIIIDM